MWRRQRSQFKQAAHLGAQADPDVNAMHSKPFLEPGSELRQILPNPSMPQVVVGMLLRRLAPSCGWSVQLLHELSSSTKV